MSMHTSPTIVLAIDPGYDRCGWAVVEVTGQDVKPLEFDCFMTNRKQEKYDRFRALWSHLDDLFTRFTIKEVAMETLFFSRNVSTALPVSEVRGLIAGMAIEHQAELYEYAPGQIKVAVTGSGRADKTQMLQMVQRLLRLENIPKIDDTGDALAVAITHAVLKKTHQHDSTSLRHRL